MIVVYYKTLDQHHYFIRFHDAGKSRNFTVEGLIENATGFETLSHAMAAARLIVIDYELKFKKR